MCWQQWISAGTVTKQRDSAIPLANTREIQLLEIRGVVSIVIQLCQSSGTGRRERKKQRAAQSTRQKLPDKFIYPANVTRGV